LGKTDSFAPPRFSLACGFISGGIMRSFLLATTMVVFPPAAFAQSNWALPAPVAMGTDAPIPLPPTMTVGGPPVPLMPTATPIVSEQPTPLRLPLSTPAATASKTPSDLKAIPVFAHIAAAGATLSDLGTSHGLRTISARNGAQVMVFQLSPDGQATVAGLMTDLSVDQLRAIGGKDLVELPPQHGLRALFLHNGPQFQVFYASPDNERIIPGIMWDAGGKDLTRDQVASIPGTIPTVTIGSDIPGGGQAATPGQTAGSANLLAVVQSTTHGSIGNASAPELWMFVDPQCSFSVRAMQQLTPFITAGKVRVNVIPLSILDSEDNGMSTRSALNLVSAPGDQLVSAWASGNPTGTPAPDASAKLQLNMAAAAAIHLQGTPTLIWRKGDGTAGRLDGIPSDIGSLVASIGR
jgi:thiol:disulfide interchange protein DsbG